MDEQGSDEDAPENRTARSRRRSIREWSWLDGLRWAVYVSGITYIVANAIVNISYTQTGFRNASESVRWLQAVSGVAYTIFLVSVGAFVVTWLRDRE
jgi:hypothetical protein